MGRVTAILVALLQGRDISVEQEADLRREVQTLLNEHGTKPAAQIASLIANHFSTSNKISSNSTVREVVDALIPVLQQPISESTEVFDRFNEEEQLYLLQATSFEEANILLDRYTQATEEEREQILIEIQIHRQQRSPWNEIKNPRMLSGYSPLLLSEDQLILTPDDFAFDFGDLDYLVHTRRNPYTQKPLTLATIADLTALLDNWRYYLKPFPLDQVLEGLVIDNTWCPDKRVQRKGRQPSTTVYYSSLVPNDPIHWRPGFSIPANFHYDKLPWSPYYVYEVQLRSSIRGGQPFTRREIVSSVLIHDPWIKSPQPITQLAGWIRDPPILQAIHAYHQVRSPWFRLIDPKLWPRFEALHFKEPFPQRLYRGLYNPTFLKSVNVGDMVNLSSQKVQSWTTSLCIAEKYAMLGGKHGVVLSAILQPDDIIIDSRFIHIDQLREHARNWVQDPNSVLFIPHQNEILSKPSQRYMCRVEKILFSQLNSAYFTGSFPEAASRDDLVHGWNYI